jgi:hypothetical protein
MEGSGLGISFVWGEKVRCGDTTERRTYLCTQVHKSKSQMPVMSLGSSRCLRGGVAMASGGEGMPGAR